MTEDKKVGQLFINLNNRFDDDFVNHIVATYHPGGMRYNHTDSTSVQAHIRHAQSRSKIPLLVASNIEAGGNGACTDGTHVATPLQTASTPDTEAARQMGLVGARESRALGCNWAFTPIVDIHSNWRNTVIATRAFGNDHETVITYAQAYCDGVREGAGDRPIALCMKHFPGDGRDERDQHVVTSYNDCSVEEWDASYRKIWEWGIEKKLPTVAAATSWGARFIFASPPLIARIPMMNGESRRYAARTNSCPRAVRIRPGRRFRSRPRTFGWTRPPGVGPVVLPAV